MFRTRFGWNPGTRRVNRERLRLGKRRPWSSLGERGYREKQRNGYNCEKHRREREHYI
jgi:hypothetical protein